MSHVCPWLPRGGTTALGGRATELMGDVIVFLLSEKDRDRQKKRQETNKEGMDRRQRSQVKKRENKNRKK